MIEFRPHQPCVVFLPIICISACQHKNPVYLILDSPPVLIYCSSLQILFSLFFGFSHFACEMEIKFNYTCRLSLLITATSDMDILKPQQSVNATKKESGRAHAVCAGKFVVIEGVDVHLATIS